jgi:DNA-binding transcriptional MerR regulator
MDSPKPLSMGLTVLARRVGLDPDVIEYCWEAELVQPAATEYDLAELRRVRRLQALGVNLAGIEIILRMRRRLLAMQAEMDRVEKKI